MIGRHNEITLREAAKLTGYTSDYVGSLIRTGKIPGKRIVGTSAWVTTEEAILSYTRENRGGRLASRREHALTRFALQEESSFLLRRGGHPITLIEFSSGAVIVISLLFSFFLFHVYSVVSEKASLQSALQVEKLERRSDRNPITSFYEK